MPLPHSAVPSCKLVFLHTGMKKVWSDFLYFGVCSQFFFVCRLTKLERFLNAGVSANAGDGTKANNRAIHWAATFGGHEAVKLLCGEC